MNEMNNLTLLIRGRFSVCSTLDLPNEILVMIILHFDARERLALGNSCQRFHDLVFGDKELLRNLDFTKEVYRTNEWDIEKYFNDEKTYNKILGLNIDFVETGNGLKSLIGKAINLVDLNIQSALYFESVEELSCLLKPLVHLKRLSVSWPDLDEELNYDDPNRNEVLEEPLSRLEYLSVQIEYYSKNFLLILQLCQQLEQLRLKVLDDSDDYGSPSRRKPMKVGSLKSVQITTSFVQYLGPIRDDFMTIVSDPAEWTDFFLVDSDYAVYLERNVEVSAELGQVGRMPLPYYIADLRVPGMVDEGWPLVPELLLSKVIKVTHDDVPEKCCCLSLSQHPQYKPCLRLQVDEAKKLLKDPEYQISWLNCSHVIEKNCDVHLLASAFPNLSTLFLSQISNRNSILVPKETKPFQRRLRKKGSLASVEDSTAGNTDSSFKMLVENTPHLKVLEIFPRCRENKVEIWDLDALYLISGWKNLTVIRLYNIPITDGKFLIDIGRECEKLEEVKLHRLGPNTNCSWERELLQMLQHCKNLRKLSIKGKIVEHLAAMINILSNCSRLSAVRLGIIPKKYNFSELTSSVEKMIRQCQELNKFCIDINSSEKHYKFRLAVEGISSEFNRSDFQFHSTWPDSF